ncbi:hypothetical protein RMSM_02496, partial [Rhodopirellula maiorica SM1]
MTTTIDTAADIDARPPHPHDVPYLRLSSECVRECGIGPAITMAVYYQQAGASWNFRKLETLGLVKITGFGIATIKRHLTQLTKHGWIGKRFDERAPADALHRDASRIASGAQ